MSRFFQVSDSSSSDSESDQSDRENEQVQPTKRTAAKPQNKFKHGLMSDEEEEEKRIVKSAKEKRYEELQALIKQLKNSKKINDFTNVFALFDDLTKVYDKSRTTLARFGEGVPPFYIKCIADLDDYIAVSWEDKELRARLSKINGRFLGTLRQKIRKYNKDFAAEIKEYRENPWESGPEAEADDVPEPESDDEGITGGFTTSEMMDLKKDKKTQDEESSESSWGESSATSSISSVEIKREGDRLVLKNIAQYFLKKERSEKTQTKESNKEKEIRKLDRKKRKEEERLLRQKRDAEDFDPKEKTKLFAKDSEVSHEMLMKKFVDIMSARGKKGTDKNEQIDLLTELLEISVTSKLGPGVACKIHMNLISSIFDLNTNIFESMKLPQWLLALDHLEKLCVLLHDNLDVLRTDIKFTEEEETLKKPSDDPKPTDNEQEAESKTEDTGDGKSGEILYKVNGCILTMINRLATEFIKILQDSDCHSTDYIDKLRYEPRVYALTVNCQSYLEKSGADPDVLCKCYLSRLELLYYKFDPQSVNKSNVEADGAEEKEKEKASAVSAPQDGMTSEKIVDKLCKFIYTNDKTNWIRTRAVLCQIFHLALHDKWFEARDLMLMSHLQESIQFADVETQLLYNRTLVQLGLCAFRHGNIRVAHDALLDLQSSGRKKELLAQGLSTRTAQERTPEQEKVERRRQQAFHTHINLDLLECVYLVSAMLLEIPYMASHEGDTKRRMISKSFHNQLKQSERQPLPGPPENMHEHVIAAAKAMRMGEWRQCYDYIVNAKMNARVWDLFPRPESVKQILKRKIQEESLRAYLFTFGNKFATISLDNLAHLFELEKQTVHSIISKMIFESELQASWDEPSNCIVAHRSDPSSVQKLCNQLTEKLNHLVENNERLLEAMGMGNKSMQYMFHSSGHHRSGDKGGRGGGGDGNNDRENRGKSGGGGEGRGNQSMRMRQDRGGYNNNSNNN